MTGAAGARLTQMELALDAGVLTRHLSFVETGRSRPSSTLVLHLAEQLEVPLRERNELLLAAGYAPHYAARDLDDPALTEVRAAVMVPMRLAPPAGQDGPKLAFFSTITTFGTAVDVTFSELAVEAFFPADPETADALRAGGAPAPAG